MKIGPKYKVCKRLGAAVFEKCQTQKFQLAEARAPRKGSKRGGRGGGGDFGLQLLEKQKARFMYGLSERQFARYAHEAIEKKGVPAAPALVSRLESRLDNVVYRAGLAPTRRAARQLVSHGHITVNGRPLSIPSYAVSLKDAVAVRPESRLSPFFAARAEKMLEVKAPQWMKIEDNGFGIRLNSTPETSGSELPFDPAVIIQFYSR